MWDGFGRGTPPPPNVLIQTKYINVAFFSWKKNALKMSHVFLEQNGSNMEKMPVKPPNCLETSHGAQMLHHREMSVGTDHVSILYVKIVYKNSE